MERLTNNEYTPTTEEVRERYWINDGAISDEREGLEFDRWLRSIKATAWNEGFSLATRNSPLNPHPMSRLNPYGLEFADDSE